MNFKEYLKEGTYFDTLKLPLDTVEIFKNPSQSDVGTIYGKQIDYDRGILAKNGILYVWSGEKNALHGAVARGIHQETGIFLYIYPKNKKVDISFYESPEGTYKKYKVQYHKKVKDNKNLSKFMQSKQFKIGFDHIN